MDLETLLADLQQRLLSTLGMISIISVAFLPVSINVLEPGTWQAETRLEGAVTDDIKILIQNSTLISITYNIRFLTTGGKKLVSTVKKTILYKSLHDIYEVNTGSEVKEFRELEEAVLELTSISITFNPEGKKQLVIKASLDIPDVEDKQLVEQLWGGSAPTVTYSFND
jgi:hypothetical protein